MTTLTIPANDHGKIRVFSLPAPLPAGLAEKTDTAMLAAFGTTELNTDFVDIVDMSALGGMTLAQFLSQGYDITPDEVDATALARINGNAALIMSRATGGTPVALALRPGVEHVTTCGDAARLTAPAPLRSEASQGVIEPGTGRSDAAMSGRIATIAILVLVAVAALMVWIAG